MGIGLAFKAFIKALRNPEKAKEFLAEETKDIDNGDYSHLRLLATLQQSARLIDFFKEDISHYEDAQIGAAMRKIHQDCSKTLEEWITIRPLMEEKEGARINVPKEYDPTKIKVVGKVKGEPPYQGILVHPGWKAHKRSLPKKGISQPAEVLSPAEIEVR